MHIFEKKKKKQQKQHRHYRVERVRIHHSNDRISFTCCFIHVNEIVDRWIEIFWIFSWQTLSSSVISLEEIRNMSRIQKIFDSFINISLLFKKGGGEEKEFALNPKFTFLWLRSESLLSSLTIDMNRSNEQSYTDIVFLFFCASR